MQVLLNRRANPRALSKPQGADAAAAAATAGAGDSVLSYCLQLDRPESLACAAMLLVMGAKPEDVKDGRGEGFIHRAVRYGGCLCLLVQLQAAAERFWERDFLWRFGGRAACYTRQGLCGMSSRMRLQDLAAAKARDTQATSNAIRLPNRGRRLCKPWAGSAEFIRLWVRYGGNVCLLATTADAADDLPEKLPAAAGGGAGGRRGGPAEDYLDVVPEALEVRVQGWRVGGEVGGEGGVTLMIGEVSGWGGGGVLHS